MVELGDDFVRLLGKALTRTFIWFSLSQEREKLVSVESWQTGCPCTR